MVALRLSEVSIVSNKMVKFQRKSMKAHGPLFTSREVLVVQQPEDHEIQTRNI